MIIQHRDGSAEICALPPPLVRWARELLRRAQWRRADSRPCLATAAASQPACDEGCAKDSC